MEEGLPGGKLTPPNPAFIPSSSSGGASGGVAASAEELFIWVGAQWTLHNGLHTSDSALLMHRVSSDSELIPISTLGSIAKPQ